MKTQLLHRPEIQQVSGPLVLALDELVSAHNVQPLEIGDSKIRSGTGTPEGRVVGNPGDVYLRTDGTAGLVRYLKATGTHTTTGWVPNGAARSTWTPVDSSGAGLALTPNLPSLAAVIPLTVGSLVTVRTGLSYPGTASGAAVKIGGLPVPCGSSPGAGSLAFTNSGVAFTVYVRESLSQIELFTLAGVAVTNAQLTGSFLAFTATYFTT